MDRTYGLTHIQIAVSDLERSLRFYRDAFGLVERFRISPLCVMMGSPDAHDIVTINAEAGNRDQPIGTTGAIAHFGFRLRSSEFMPDVLRDAVAAGGTILGTGKRGKPDQRETYAMVRDPDGYEVEVFGDIAE